MDTSDSENPGSPVIDEKEYSDDESNVNSDKNSVVSSDNEAQNSEDDSNEEINKSDADADSNVGSDYEPGSPKANSNNDNANEKSDSGDEIVARNSSDRDSNSDNESKASDKDDDISKEIAGSDHEDANKSSKSDAEESDEENNLQINSDNEHSDEDDVKVSSKEHNNESDHDNGDLKDVSHSDTDAKSGSDSDSEPIQKRKKLTKKVKKVSNENDESDKESNVGELIADIFGDSDNEEEFEGFEEDDVSKKKAKKQSQVLSDSENEEKKSDDDVDVGVKDDKPDETITQRQEPIEESSDDEDFRRGNGSNHEYVSDFDLMMQRKKDEQKSRRKRGSNVDIINDNDDLIAELIHKMKIAAEEDCELNRQKKAATKKLILLPLMLSQIRKQDLMMAFLDQGVLRVMTDWLSPLPDKSLPHIQIREKFLKLLSEFPVIDQQLLKSSGIGRATMYLYKHPKESKSNRIKAGRLINEWSRPIFNLSTNFHAVSKEEREQRDFDHMPKKRKMSVEDGKGANKSQDIDKAMTGEGKALKPGEKGWIGRARVPMPSTKDYVVRPEWNIEGDISKAVGKKQVTRLDKHIRAFADRKRRNKNERAVKISIEGSKMAL